MTELEMVSFLAAGRPATKGSTRSFMAKGRMVTKGDNPRTKSWQGVVAHAAHEAGVRPAVAGVELVMEFRFARPKAHRRSGKRSHELREDAPPAPVGRGEGDVDKLARAVLDALTGVAYADDSQVIGIRADKRWCEGHEAEGVAVEVWSSKAGLA